MKLDFFTLYITIILVSFALAAIWMAIAWKHRTFFAARIWLAACLMTATGGVILPFQHMTGSFVPAAAGNGLVILGFWLFLVGARRFHGKEGGWPTAGMASAICVLLTIAFFRNTEAVALVYAIGQSIPMALSILFLMSRTRRSIGAFISCAGIAVGLAGHTAVVLMNVWLIAGLDAFGDFVAIASVTMLGVIFSGILWNFGFAVMTIDRLRDEVAELANVDPLTGAWNRRKFDQRLALENTRAARTGRPYALLLLDLDHFKAVNDRVGHKGGDESLSHFVRIVATTLRDTDLLARLGGDEFCVLMPDTSANKAWELGRRIARSLSEKPLHYDGQEVQLSCSIGVSVWSGQVVSRDDAVLSRADEALYSVKSAGRNGVSLAPPALVPDQSELLRSPANDASVSSSQRPKRSV